MPQIIDCYRQDSTVGYAHSISSDFWHPHHMSAGVAVVFRENFGRPTPSQSLTSHLAIHTNKDEAAVYSLVTKRRYFGKPKLKDYNLAFGDLTRQFKRRGLKHLIELK